MDNQIESRVQAIFRELFDNNNLVIKNNMTADDIEEWDSINHISLIVLLEQEFDIRFALEEMKNLQNVGAMLELIKKKCS